VILNRIVCSQVLCEPALSRTQPSHDQGLIYSLLLVHPGHCSAIESLELSTVERSEV
jgi:hypothetical protein